MSTIETSDSLKIVREALAVAQVRYRQVATPEANDRVSGVLGRLIDDIDRQRPLGPDGTHGDRHTATCGCEDKP